MFSGHMTFISLVPIVAVSLSWSKWNYENMHHGERKNSQRSFFLGGGASIDVIMALVYGHSKKSDSLFFSALQLTELSP